jgi:hypothetical protein
VCVCLRAVYKSYHEDPRMYVYICTGHAYVCIYVYMLYTVSNHTAAVCIMAGIVGSSEVPSVLLKQVNWCILLQVLWEVFFL